MSDLTPARLAELRAVAEAVEPSYYACDCADMCRGGCPDPKPVYATIDNEAVLALIAALEAKTAEVEDARKYRTLPPGYVWQDYYSPDEVIVIRREVEFAIETAERERDEARAVIEQVRKEAEDMESWYCTNPDAASLARDILDLIRDES